MIARIVKFFKDWNGFIHLPIAILVWCLSPRILRAWDSTAGTFDAGVLQIFLFGLIGVSFGSFLSFVFLKLDFPTLDKWMDVGGFAKDWKGLSCSERIKYSLWVFFGFLFAFVLFCRVL